MTHEFWKDRVEISKEGLTVEGLKKHLVDLCDLDYNGSNGEDYFKDITKQDYDELTSHNIDAKCIDERYCVSYLDYMWYRKTKDKTEEEIINNASSILESILQDNYEFGDYEFGLAEVVDTPTKIVVIIAHATYI